MLTTIKGIAWLTSSACAAVALGSVTDNALDENTPVSLGAVLTCACVVISGAWWLSRKMAMQEQMHKENRRRFKILEQNVRAIQKKLGVQNVEPEAED